MVVNLQRAGFLVLVPGLLEEFAVEPSEVLKVSGLESDALNDPEKSLPFDVMGRLIEACVQFTGCHHFGLLIGQRASALSLGQIGELMSHAPNLGTVMRDLVQHQYRHARGAVVYLLELGEETLLGYAVYERDAKGAMQLYDGAVAMAVGIIRRALGVSKIDGLNIMLSRGEPADIEPYKRCFGTRPRFNSDYNGVLFPSAWMDRPVVGADPARREALERAIEPCRRVGEHDMVTRLRRAASVALLTGQTSNIQLAGELGVSRRTLRRRLGEVGTSFQHVLDETRFEFAKQFLANTQVNLAHIACVLGYADQSVFTRSFSRWSGVPPGEWQRLAGLEQLSNAACARRHLPRA